MVLVANKVDLVHLRKITSDQGQEMAAKHNVSSERSLKHVIYQHIVFVTLISLTKLYVPVSFYLKSG